ADMELQRLKFAEMITDIVRFAHRPEALEEDLEHLADRHVEYGVVAADYDAVGGILLASLEEVLGPKFTPEIRDAWAEAYTSAARTMLARHRRKGGR
ncbi:MAG TPA: globin domain-containing protein, partial [Gemmatimonadales bacterium]